MFLPVHHISGLFCSENKNQFVINVLMHLTFISYHTSLYFNADHLQYLLLTADGLLRNAYYYACIVLYVLTECFTASVLIFHFQVVAEVHYELVRILTLHPLNMNTAVMHLRHVIRFKFMVLIYFLSARYKIRFYNQKQP